MCAACQREYEMEWRKRNKPKLKEARMRRASGEREYRKQYNARNRGHILVSEARRRALRKSIPFDLDDHVDEIEARVQNGTCEMTGLPFNLHATQIGWDSASLDKIDPNKGYVYGNVRIVCFGMNAALGHWGEKVLRKMLTAWSKKSA